MIRPEPVKAELLADVSAMAPGKPFRMGVLFEIDPEWHIYWKHPGDAGLPTELKFSFPQGFEVGPILWPVPLRFDMGGDLTGYGYAGSVMLMAEVTPPAGIEPGATIPISVNASWLGCRHICLQGSKELSANLAVAQEAVPANNALFEEWAARLPRTLADLGEVGAVDAKSNNATSGDATEVNVTVAWETVPETVEFFPAGATGLLLEKVVVQTTERKSEIRFMARQTGENRVWGVSGVVVFKLADGARKAFEMEVSPPSASPRP